MKTFLPSPRARRLLLAFTLLLGSVAAAARGGVLAGSAGKLSVTRTVYFDIIFPPESAVTAANIAAVCDGYYEEVCAAFLIEPYQRFPVTITPSVESLNAYFSLYPYNRIVLYDTPPETSLDMNAETMERVFYHELVHAVTGNIKSRGWRFWSGFVGEFLSPTFFARTPFWIEGTAVEAESRVEGGRLNDPYSTRLVAQAKLEGRFPSWRDVTGARDVYPGGTDAYLFGALFSRYLCETYGREQFAASWKRLGYGTKAVPEDELCAAVTGKRMKATWRDFEDWLTVPDCTPVPDEATGSVDFFVAAGLATRRRSGFSRQNERLSLFSAVDTSRYGAAWTDLQTGGVWYARYGADGWQQPKKLFTASSVSRIALSDDGRYLAASYLYERRVAKTAVCVYDLERGSLVTVPHASIRDAGFVRGADDRLLLCAVNTARAPYTLDCYTVGDRRRDFTRVSSIPLAADEYAYTPVDAGNGALACIVKHTLDWKLRIYAADGSAFCEYGTARTILHHLHAARAADGRRVFSFSYARMGTVGTMLPRAGLLYTDGDTAELVLQDDDSSGGVLDAALLPAALVSGDEQLLYVAGFYDTWRLMQLDMARRAVVHHAGVAAPARVATTAVNGAGQHGADSDFSAVGDAPMAVDYAPFRYAKNGIFVPLCTTVLAYSGNLASTGGTGSIGDIALSFSYLGATFLTSNPWGDHVLLVSGGWDLHDGVGGNVRFSGGDNTSAYSLSGTVIGSVGAGFLQTTGSAALSHTLYARYGRSITAGAEGRYLYGYGMEYDDEGALLLTAEKDWAASGTVYARFSTVHKRAPGYFQYGGVYVQPFLFGFRTDMRCMNTGVTVGARVPGLFPLTLTATLFPDSDYCASIGVSAVLFCREIQRAIPAIYTDRVYLSGGYSAALTYDTGGYFDIARTAAIFRDVTASDYRDVVQLKAGIIMSVNCGCAAYVRFDMGAVVQYRPNVGDDRKKLGAGMVLDIVY